MDQAVAIPEKTLKRIDALCTSSSMAIILLVVGFCIPIVSLFTIVVGLLYGIESHYYLKKYPELDVTRRNGLHNARTIYLVVGSLPLALFVLLMICIVIVGELGR